MWLYYSRCSIRNSVSVAKHGDICQVRLVVLLSFILFIFFLFSGAGRKSVSLLSSLQLSSLKLPVLVVDLFTSHKHDWFIFNFRVDFWSKTKICNSSQSLLLHFCQQSSILHLDLLSLYIIFVEKTQSVRIHNQLIDCPIYCCLINNYNIGEIVQYRKISTLCKIALFCYLSTCNTLF